MEWVQQNAGYLAAILLLGVLFAQQLYYDRTIKIWQNLYNTENRVATELHDRLQSKCWACQLDRIGSIKRKGSLQDDGGDAF